MFQRIMARLGPMRRAVEWTVYPRDQAASPYVVIQSVREFGDHG